MQAVELLPVLRHAQLIRTWGGTEGYLPDREPVLGPSRTTPGLFHGFGFSGAGFQIGPAAGEVLAELARDGRTEHAHRRLRHRALRRTTPYRFPHLNLNLT